MDHGAFLAAVERGAVPPVLLLHGPEPLPRRGGASADSRARCSRRGADLRPRPRDPGRARGGHRCRRARGSDLAIPRRPAPRGGAGRRDAGREGRGRPPRLRRGAEPHQRPASCSPSGSWKPATGWCGRSRPPRWCHWPSRRGAGSSAWLRARARAAGIDLAEDAAQMLVRPGRRRPRRPRHRAGEGCPCRGTREPPRRRRRRWRTSSGRAAPRSIFELPRALEARDRGRALAVLQALLDAGEEPLGVARHARRARRARPGR